MPPPSRVVASVVFGYDIEVKLVVATHNVKKASEMLTILMRGLPSIELLTLAEFPGAPEPDESGETYEENAAIKALSASRYTHEWSLADDAGLEIDAIEGAPGVKSKRFGGEELPFEQKMAKILRMMSGITNPEERSARFRCHVALAAPGGGLQHFEAICEGQIAIEPSGSGGFGYDPIFWLPELGKTMADLTPEEKHAISHRGKVLAQVIEYLAERLVPVQSSL